MISSSILFSPSPLSSHLKVTVPPDESDGDGERREFGRKSLHVILFSLTLPVGGHRSDRSVRKKTMTCVHLRNTSPKVATRVAVFLVDRLFPWSYLQAAAV